MAGIRGKNTKPEIIIRKGLHSLGFRFRLHDKRLPGTPDIVLPRYRAVIFVHGCFWHGHGCHLFKQPKSRSEFWAPKIESNKARDTQVYQRLHKQGFRIAEVWECATKGKTRPDPASVIQCLSDWIKSDRPFLSVVGLHITGPSPR